MEHRQPRTEQHNRRGFSGGYDEPVINRAAFYWYIFVIPNLGRYRADHYFVCDYLQMRGWLSG